VESEISSYNARIAIIINGNGVSTSTTPVPGLPALSTTVHKMSRTKTQAGAFPGIDFKGGED
jgi:hypothetical protein